MTNFIQRCIGIALIVAATGFLVRVVMPAKATPAISKKQIIDDSGKTVGQYMITMSSFLDSKSKDGGIYTYLIVWDTETGKSARYTYSGGSFARTDAQLPSHPMESDD